MSRETRNEKTIRICATGERSVLRVREKEKDVITIASLTHTQPILVRAKKRSANDMCTNPFAPKKKKRTNQPAIIQRHPSARFLLWPFPSLLPSRPLLLAPLHPSLPMTKRRRRLNVLLVLIKNKDH
jgi:hypothetical protein